MPPTPLRPLRSQGDSSPESPEALAISAMLSTGEFRPDKYGLTEDDLTCWTKLWRFCVEYQTSAGVAPPAELLARKFPDFEITPRVDISWAVGQLRKAAASRALRRRFHTALQSLNEDDLDGAYEALEGLARPRGMGRRGDDAFDHSMIAEDFESSKYPVPFTTLGRVTGGIAPSELWYVAARAGEGKSCILSAYAARLVKEGNKVGVLSIEMSAPVWAKRAHRVMAYPDLKLVKAIDSTDYLERKKALDTLRDKMPGSLTVSDPKHGLITLDSVRDMLDSFDVVIVDHIGLMRTSDGTRAIEDWRVMAKISNQLHEEVLATGTSVLAAAQINREGDDSSSRPAKAKYLSQSKALEEDGDVVITMKRLSRKTMAHSAEKVRNKPNVRWWSHYDPAVGRYDEITWDQCQEIVGNDELLIE